MALESDDCCENVVFDIFRGDDIAKQVTIKDTSNGAWNITGWSFQVLIKKNANNSDDEAIVNKTFGPLTGINAEQGFFYITLNKYETSLLKNSSYYIVIKKVYIGLSSTVIAGNIKVRGKVRWREVNGD